jgi:hypothetical protein
MSWTQLPVEATPAEKLKTLELIGELEARKKNNAELTAFGLANDAETVAVKKKVTFKKEKKLSSSSHDPVNHPKHYTEHPSGIECIQITEHMGFNLGNALKYIWRADLKNNAVEDLQKAVWYINREIDKRSK